VAQTTRITHIKLPRETGKARLSVDTRQDMDGQLLRLFDDDMLALWVPSNHVMVLRSLQKTVINETPQAISDGAVANLEASSYA
jgi:hypothetical protein